MVLKEKNQGFPIAEIPDFQGGRNV